MKRFISVILSAAVAVGLLAGCGQSGSTATGTAGGTETGAAVADGETQDFLYHAYMSTPYVTLDPSAEGSNGIMVLRNVYETLTYYNDETDQAEPQLAESWSHNDDNTEWVFQIRQGVTFHDGTAVNAEAVAASIMRTKELVQGGSYIWDPVTDIEVTGEYEVTFTCSEPSSLDLIAASCYASYIMSLEASQQDTAWFNAGNDGGSGPYTIQSVTNDSVVLQAYEDYRDGWTDDQYKSVVIREVSESSSRRQLLETGEAQIASNFSTTDLQALRDEQDKVHTYISDSWQNVIIFLNTKSYPCNNADFRRALAYAFPYQEVIDHVLDGAGSQSYGMIPSGIWGHNEELFQYTTDLDKAKEYLDASGVDTSDLTVIFTYTSGFDAYSTFAQMFQANLKEIGITLDLRSVEWDTQFSMANNTNPEDRQDISVMQWWPDYGDPRSWFSALVHTTNNEGSSMGWSYLDDPELDAMIDEAVVLSATDREGAVEIYNELQEILLDECYFIFPYDMANQYVISNSITGVHENPAYAGVIQYYDVRKAE